MRLSRLRVRRVVVHGRSMEPTLVPGDRLLILPVLRLLPGLRVRPGDIVAVPDPRDPPRILVKRVVTVDSSDRQISLEGDNRDQSTDSRIFGAVACADVVGRAVYRYAPLVRAGRIGRRGRGGFQRVAGPP